jgi:NADH:ubiquinone oxidoreductase subunit 3 (subunit A)
MFLPCAGSFYPFILYTILATVIASAFVVIPFVVAPARVDLEKSSAYECGFDAFGEVGGWAHVVFWTGTSFVLLICTCPEVCRCHLGSSCHW